MSDTDGSDNKIGGRGRGGPGGGVGGGRGSVRQSFSHGRSKAVVVETKRKRILSAPDGAAKSPAAAAAVAATLTAKPKPKVAAPAQAPRPAEKKDAKPRNDRGGGKVLGTLSDVEYKRRLVALKQAKRDEESRRIREAAINKERAETAARRKAELPDGVT